MRTVDGISRAVNAIDLLAQKICFFGSSAFPDYSTVIDHASDTTDCIRATTEPEQPYLVVRSIVLDDELVGGDALGSKILRGDAIEEVVQKCAIEADTVMIPGRESWGTQGMLVLCIWIVDLKSHKLGQFIYVGPCASLTTAPGPIAQNYNTMHI